MPPRPEQVLRDSPPAVQPLRASDKYPLGDRGRDLAVAPQRGLVLPTLVEWIPMSGAGMTVGGGGSR